MINKYLKMFKILKLLSLVFILFFKGISYSNAECGFDGLTIGGSSVDAEGTFGEASTVNHIGVILVPVEEVCPGESLEDVSIKIIISEEQIAGFIFETESPQIDEDINNRNLYKYVTANYGNIEGSEQSDWTGSKSWEINGKEILYIKSFFLKNLVEELIVTNSNFRDVFVDSDPDLENEEEEE